MATVVVVGAGPGAVGLLERMAANADGARVDVHLVDPHPPGGGRVWRRDQSPLLWMNSMAEDVTMFTDDSCRIDGPVRPGPSLAEWAADVAPASFPTRLAQSDYLAWFTRRVLADLPPGMTARHHATTALDVTGPRDGGQTVHLADGSALAADLVVLALGHLDYAPRATEGPRHTPPGYTADLDLSGIAPGEAVAVRGFGLAFVDLMVLLGEGRGGRFTPGGYVPSGQEPVLHVGSRRGVPYHAKTGYRLRADPAALPRFLTPAALPATGPLDFYEHLWPLAAKDIGWGYYHELFLGHPDRVRMDFAEFEARYADADPDKLTALVADAVPDPADRLDLARFDRPLAGLRFPDRAALAAHLRAHVAADLARAADQRFSADLGGFHALLAVYGALAVLAGGGRLDPASRLSGLEDWWPGFFSFYASGPPPERLRQLLALAEAGVVRFVGPDMRVRPDGDGYLVDSPAVPGAVRTTALVDARLPAPDLARAVDPLVRTLRDRGVLTEEVLGSHPTGRLLVDPAGAVVDATGRALPRLYATGPHTSSRAAPAFSRPRTNAFAFRRADAMARHLLSLVDGAR